MDNVTSINQLAGWVETNPWWGFIGCIFAVVALIGMFVLYIKGKKIKLPYYIIRSINIVKDYASRIESLELLYSGQKIENLTITKIAFWNGGRDTIDKSDIAPADPLAIRIKGDAKILDTRIIFEKNPANKFSIILSTDQTYVTSNFDFIDKDEGVVIELIHTGKSNKDIEFTGTIKGAGNIMERFYPHSRRFPYFFPCRLPITGHTKALRYIMAGLLFVLPIFLLITPSSEVVAISPQAERLIVTTILICFYWPLGYLMIKRWIPKGFDIFEEDF